MSPARTCAYARESRRNDVPVLDVKAGSCRDTREQAGLGCGHIDLPPTFEPCEQGRPPLRIKVRSDFVQEQDRTISPPVGNEVGMGQDKAEKKRLLFPCR